MTTGCAVRLDDWQDVVGAVRRLQGDLDGVLREIARTIRDELPEYALVTEEQLTEATSRNIRDVLTALSERRLLTPAELQDFTLTVQERARDGVPIEQYLQALALAEVEVWEQLARRAGRLAEPRRLELFALRFANVQAITRTTVTAHRRVELRAAREDQERRALALRVLLQGGLPAEGARESLARLGLVADRAYYVVRARARTGAADDRLTQLLAAGCDRSPHAAFVLWGEDMVGLLRDRPSAVHGVVGGAAGPAPLEHLAEAHEQATTAFETAWALGLEGTHELGELGIKAAVQSSPQVGQALRERFLAPLTASGTLGPELLATTRTYLECGSSREAAAAALHLHQNTVGYRLNRFTELTGADLSDLATLAELHWLFTDLDLRPPS